MIVSFFETPTYQHRPQPYTCSNFKGLNEASEAKSIPPPGPRAVWGGGAGPGGTSASSTGHVRSLECEGWQVQGSSRSLSLGEDWRKILVSERSSLTMRLEKNAQGTSKAYGTLI